MSGDVKRRPYRSARRQEQAAETRERILAAAGGLFLERGYEGTSIAAVAAAAEVSEETIYARFRNKRTILGELVQRAVRGKDPRPVLEQQGPRAVAASADQREQIRLFAADVARRLERAAPLVATVHGAARSEPELGELLGRLHEDRRRNLRGFVEALLANGKLRVPRERAVEDVWALQAPELYETLTRVGGWTRERYAEWLSDMLEASLLRL